MLPEITSRRSASLRSADDAEDMAIRIWRERAHDAQAGAAHPGGFGLSLFSWRGHAGSQDTERISSASSRGDRGYVHRGVDVFARRRNGAAGDGSHRFDAGERIGLARPAAAPGSDRARVAEES